MKRIALLALLCMTMAACCSHRKAQPAIDVQEQLMADTAAAHHERRDSTRVDATATGSVVVHEDTRIEYDSVGNPTRITRTMSMDWLAGLEGLMEFASSGDIDLTASRISREVQLESPAVVPASPKGTVLDTVKWIALMLCMYGIVIIIKNWISLWRN